MDLADEKLDTIAEVLHLISSLEGINDYRPVENVLSNIIHQHNIVEYFQQLEIVGLVLVTIEI